MTRRKNKDVIKYYPNKLYIFICEDAKSMRYYLEGLKPYLKPNITIQTKHANSGNTARKVYDCAVAEYKRIYEKKDSYKNGFEIIACFDKDENSISDIRYILSRNNKKILSIYNNPCYEYWLYLHMERNNPIFASSEDCEKKCRNKINSTYKTNFKNANELKSCKKIFEIVKKDLPKALENAQSLSLQDYDATYTNTHVVIKNIVDLRNLT